MRSASVTSVCDTSGKTLIHTGTFDGGCIREMLVNFQFDAKTSSVMFVNVSTPRHSGSMQVEIRDKFFYPRTGTKMHTVLMELWDKIFPDEPLPQDDNRPVVVNGIEY